MKRLPKDDVLDRTVVTSLYTHWAYADYRDNKPSSAIKNLKKAIEDSPDDPANWALWGVVSRSVGNYETARAKFERALVLDPDYTPAKQELKVLDVVIKMDATFTLDQVPEIMKMRTPGCNTRFMNKNSVCGVI